MLETICEILEHDNIQVRTFVNGSLYSLMSRPVLKAQAREIGMPDMLEAIVSNSDDRIQK